MAQPNSTEKKEDKTTIATKTVKVASIQAPSVFKDTQANIKLFTQLIKKAAANGAKIIVLPEAAITGYASQDFQHSWCIPIKSREAHLDKNKFTGHDPEQYAELQNGAMIQHFQTLCAELKIYLTVPFVEKVPCALETENPLKSFTIVQNKFFEAYKFKFYNAITLINPNGEIVAHYRKTNLWPYYDHPWATPGDELVTVDTEYGKVGLGICFDIHKILPGYKELKIWTLLYCIAWVDDADFKWFSDYLPKILKRKDIPYNVIGCNWSVEKCKTKCDDIEQKNNNDAEEDKIEMSYEWNGFGKTHLYGPNGKIIACTDKLFGNEILYADLPWIATQQ